MPQNLQAAALLRHNPSHLYPLAPHPLRFIVHHVSFLVPLRCACFCPFYGPNALPTSACEDGRRNIAQQVSLIFAYAIDKEAKEIRLVPIQPTLDSKAHVRLIVKHVNLGDYGEFNHQLYTHGITVRSKYKERQRFIAGFVAYKEQRETNRASADHAHGDWQVRENLHNFLLATRDAVACSLWFWIDQIWIDQADDDEKGHQVNLMAEIYTRATKVEVWLGPAFPGSDPAMELLGQPIHSSKDSTLGIEKHPLALGTIVNLPYWSRLWIVQEILLMHDVWVRLGDKILSWDHLRLSFFILIMHHFNEGHTIYGDGAAAQSLVAAVGFQTPGSSTFGEVLAVARDKSCEDDRDRVFGMLGLVREQLRFQPDYSIELQGLWLQVLRLELSTLDEKAQFEDRVKNCVIILRTDEHLIGGKIMRRFMLNQVYPILAAPHRPTRSWTLAGIFKTLTLHSIRKHWSDRRRRYDYGQAGEFGRLLKRYERLRVRAWYPDEHDDKIIWHRWTCRINARRFRSSA